MLLHNPCNMASTCHPQLTDVSPHRTPMTLHTAVMAFMPLAIRRHGGLCSLQASTPPCQGDCGVFQPAQVQRIIAFDGRLTTRLHAYPKGRSEPPSATHASHDKASGSKRHQHAVWTFDIPPALNVNWLGAVTLQTDDHAAMQAGASQSTDCGKQQYDYVPQLSIQPLYGTLTASLCCNFCTPRVQFAHRFNRPSSAFSRDELATTPTCFLLINETTVQPPFSSWLQSQPNWQDVQSRKLLFTKRTLAHLSLPDCMR
jgi:hypothetical protein